jgi:hypothetical protein
MRGEFCVLRTSVAGSPRLSAIRQRDTRDDFEGCRWSSPHAVFSFPREDWVRGLGPLRRCGRAARMSQGACFKGSSGRKGTSASALALMDCGMSP